VRTVLAHPTVFVGRIRCGFRRQSLFGRIFDAAIFLHQHSPVKNAMGITGDL